MWYNIDSTNTILVCRRKGGQNVTDRQDYRFILPVSYTHLNYELVYSAPLAPETSLEDIYTRFNIDHPKDFKGHSLSVSDVVVLHQDGQDAAHFVDLSLIHISGGAACSSLVGCSSPAVCSLSCAICSSARFSSIQLIISAAALRIVSRELFSSDNSRPLLHPAT